MNDLTYKKMLKDYKSILKIANKDYSEINKIEYKLSKNKNNEELNNRLDFLIGVRYSLCYEDQYYLTSSIIYLLINEYGTGKINDNNHIYVYLSDNALSYCKNYFSEYIPDDLNDENVCIYRNLEDSSDVKIIPSYSRKEFELNNKVIFGKNYIVDFEDRYDNTQYEYFKKCICENREAAINYLTSPLFSVNNRDTNENSVNLNDYKKRM